MLKNYFRDYLQSLKPRVIHGYTLLADTAYVLLMVIITTGVVRFLTEQSSRIGVPIQELQQYVLSLPPEAMELFYTQIRNIALQLIGALIIVPLIGLMLYSLSSAFIWNLIVKARLSKKNYWRWNGLYLIMPMFIILFFFAFLNLVYLLQLILFFIPQKLIQQFMQIALLVAFFQFLFVISFFFVKEYKVFTSIGHALHFLRTHKKQSLITAAFALATIFILQIIQYPFRVWYFIYPTRALVIQAVILLIYLAWFRVYVADRLKAEHVVREDVHWALQSRN